MKHLFPAAALLIALGSPVHAETFSFVIGGHRINIGASAHCGYGSCVSIALPRVAPKRTRSHDSEHPPVTSAVATAQPSAAPAASRPAPPPALCVAPSAPLRPAASQAQPVTPPPPAAPPIQPVQTQPVQPLPPPVKAAEIASPPPAPMPMPVPPSSASPPQESVPPVEVTSAVSHNDPKLAKVSHEIEDEPADTPLGDWHAEGQKGRIRIEPCGQALCGYTVDVASNGKGQTVLVDMKLKSVSKWSGNIYSRDSGNTYYGTITMKGPDALKVEACALGHFFCSATLWKRADAEPKRLITGRVTSQQPRT